MQTQIMPTRPSTIRSRRQSMRELQAANARLRARLARAVRESRRDALTGLSNRRQFDAAMSRRVRQRSETGGPIALLFIDVDHFKYINDNYGHAIGDLALQHLSRILEEVAIEGDLVCRFGGEEFVILTASDSCESLEEFGERIRVAVEQSPLATPDGLLKLTVSVGGARIMAAPEAFLSARLLQLADQAVYAAKTSGRNCVRVHQTVEAPASVALAGSAVQ